MTTVTAQRLLLRLPIERESDVVEARQRARQVAQSLGFDNQDQTRIATAVSEIARNAFSYARGGSAEFLIEGDGGPCTLVIRIVDHGPGIADLDAVLSGRYRSKTGLGAGIAGARRLVDRLAVDTGAGGTAVSLYKAVPAAGAGDTLVRRLADELAENTPTDPVAEVQRQNRELMQSLAALHRREEELHAANEELRRSLAEKQILLREIYHRVKNNLQIISSLVNLQARQSGDANVCRHLDDVRNRVESLSIIHEKLYQSEDVGRIDFAGYLRDLCDQLRRFYGPAGERIAVAIDCDDMVLPLDTAIQFGLLINEVVTNCFKHAFPEEAEGRIDISLRRRDGPIELVIRDNGRGLPADQAGGRAGSLGMTIIQALARGLDGTVSIDGRGGTAVRVEIPAEAIKPVPIGGVA